MFSYNKQYSYIFSIHTVATYIECTCIAIQLIPSYLETMTYKHNYSSYM